YRTPSGMPAMTLIPRRLAAHLLDIRAARFRLETPFHRTLGRLRRLARRRRWFGSLEDQFLQAFPGILAIALLAAKTVGLDHQYAVLRHPAAGNAGYTRLDPVGKVRRIEDVEEELNRGRYLVVVLSAGTAGQHELFGQ